jgi:arylsulfatase A-like enzyme
MQYRTLLALGGLALSALPSAGIVLDIGAKPNVIDGISLMPVLTGKTAEMAERPLFWRVGEQNAVRIGDWKLIRNGKEWQLYDLAHDISESTNLATKEPSRVRQLLALWEQWNGEQIEPLWR